jgi:2-polyprenyl-6-methoxyphenol hydroxylase-like FAD-dependent oxidoreductase
MKTKQVLIIGGGVLGPKVACRLKRLQPEWEVTLVDQEEDIAYSACGIPHYVAGDVAELKGLMTASFHMVRSPEFFENAKDVRIQTRTQALSTGRRRRSGCGAWTTVGKRICPMMCWSWPPAAGPDPWPCPAPIWPG